MKMQVMRDWVTVFDNSVISEDAAKQLVQDIALFCEKNDEPWRVIRGCLHLPEGNQKWLTIYNEQT